MPNSPDHDVVPSLAFPGRCRVCGEVRNCQLGACYACEPLVVVTTVDGVTQCCERSNRSNYWIVRDA